jgi:hypothetical protein
MMKRTIVCGLVVVSVSVLAVGCAVPEVEAREDVAETTSNLGGNDGGCELLAKAAGIGTRVAATALLATGVCAEGAVAATVVSGGLAAPGSAVCLAPAAAATAATVASLLATGLAYLICGATKTYLEEYEASEAAKAKPKNPACEGVHEKNISADSADECPKNKQATPRIDRVFCKPKGKGLGNHVDKQGQDWLCFDPTTGQLAKPHFPCLPNAENDGYVTHTHFTEDRYNFSAQKKCCFYREEPIEVKCGAY